MTSRKFDVPGMCAVLLLLSLAACTTADKSRQDAETIVMERAAQRWDSVLTGRLEQAYNMLSPAQRSSVSLLSYQREVAGSPVQWTAADVLGAECQELICTVAVEVEMNIIGAVPGVRSFSVKQKMDEQWVRSDDTWWYARR